MQVELAFTSGDDTPDRRRQAVHGDLRNRFGCDILKTIFFKPV